MSTKVRPVEHGVRIDMKEVAELASTLIRIPTVPSVHPPGEAETVRFIADLLDREGIPYLIEDVRPGRPNLIIELGAAGGRTLWLNGHLDTVPIGNRLNWRYEPFGGDVHDGAVYGRGASDGKGGLASMLIAAVAIRRAGVRLRGRLKLTVVMGEEEGQIGLKYLLDRGHAADAFVSTQWSTASQIALGCRGLCWVEVTTFGRSAHSSRPARGINAVEQMVDVVLPALRTLELPAGPATSVPLPGPSVNLSGITGGDLINLVPDRCTAALDYRLGIGQSSYDVAQAVTETLDRLRINFPQLAVEQRILLQIEPFFTSPESELVQILTAAIRNVTGGDPRYFGKTGTGDANLVWPRLGVPVVAYGPGNDSGHAPDEHVHCADLASVASVYVDLACEYLGFESRPEEQLP